MELIVLSIVGVVAGLLSGSVGFGGGMILLPVITYFYGVEVAVPVSTIAQLISNLSRVGMGWKSIEWKSVGWFLLVALPCTALGAFGFAVVDKVLMTRLLCAGLVLFACLKIGGKIVLPKSRLTMLVGGALTGGLNGLLGISGPLSSAVFLSLDLLPVAYIASEATAAAAMHVVKIVVYGKLQLMNLTIFGEGLCIGVAMMAGNFMAMRFIRHINKKRYQKVVAVLMIAVSIFLFFSVNK